MQAFRCLVRALWVAVLAWGCASAYAQGAAWPNKPIKMIIPAAAGGGTDILGRVLAEAMERHLGQPIVIENHGGGSGQIAANLVKAAAPDGYSLLMTYAGVLTVNPAIFKGMKYDPVKDFVAIAPYAEVPNLLIVNPDVPARNLNELIALARKQPGKMSYASSGNGTSIFLAMELLRQRTGLELVHAIYKGGAPAMADVMAGHVNMMFNNLVEAAPAVNGGKVRAIATGARARSPLLPNVPTFAESGMPDYTSTVWYGMVAPTGTPDAVVNRLNAVMRQVVKQPEVRAKLASMGADAMDMSPPQFADLIKNEIVLWKDVVQRAGIAPN